VCAICGCTNGARRLSVDHDHETGKVRGLLCNKCNSAIGLLGEDASIAMKMCEYILKTAQA
jgi:hypothetical protein